MKNFEALRERFCHLFLPNRCLFCKKPIGALERACPVCEAYLPRIHSALCPICGRQVCICDRMGRPFDSLIVPFYYEDSVVSAIWDMKFHDNLLNAKKLAFYLGEAIQKREAEQETDLLIPVPLYRKDYKRRGYNQSEKLAKYLGRYLNRPVCSDALLKIRCTEKQHDLPAKERKNNLRNAFSLAEPERIAGKTILLVDDVYTTGSTIMECAQQLKAGGAEKIIAVCVAKAASPIAKEDWL